MRFTRKGKKKVVISIVCVGLTSVTLLLYIGFIRGYVIVKTTIDVLDTNYYSTVIATCSRMNESEFGDTYTSKGSSLENQNPPSFHDSHFMTISGAGRLGNRMFEFASLLGVSHRHNYTPYILPRHPLVRFFELPSEYVLPISTLNNMQFINEKGAGKYLEKIETLTHDRNYSLRGYYQSWKYFQFVPNLVKKSFIFKSRFLRKAQRALKPYERENRSFVGVHIRRTDMNSEKHLKRGYNVAPTSYFEKAFNFFRRNMTNPVFLVISDDIQWTKENIKKAEDVRFVSTGTPSSDLAVMAHCKHAVISSGSFGWWGGYLTGGTVIYYGNFPTRGSWLAKRYNREDYYPPHWIAME